MDGWIKLHRKISEKPYYAKDSEKVHLWLHLLLKANHKPKTEMLGGKPIICNPGQFTTGRKQLSNETGIDENKVERALNFFEKIEGQIEQRKTNTNRLISIVNWGLYQIDEQQMNNKRTTDEQRMNTLQECKEIKNSIISPLSEVKVEKSEKSETPEKPEKTKDPIWQLIVKTWFDFYQQKFSVEPTFKPGDAANLKRIVSIAKKRAEKSGTEWNEENAVKWFNAFFSNAYKFDWIAKNFLIPNLYNQIDKILNTSNDASSNTAKVQHISKNRRAASAMAVLSDLRKELGGDLGQGTFKDPETTVQQPIAI